MKTATSERDITNASKRTLKTTLKQIKEENPRFDVTKFWTDLEKIVAQWIVVINPVLQSTYRQ